LVQGDAGTVGRAGGPPSRGWAGAGGSDGTVLAGGDGAGVALCRPPAHRMAPITRLASSLTLMEVAASWGGPHVGHVRVGYRIDDAKAVVTGGVAEQHRVGKAGLGGSCERG